MSSHEVIVFCFIVETFDDEYFERIAFGDEEDDCGDRVPKNEQQRHNLMDTEAEDILKSIGIYHRQRNKSSEVTNETTAPMNRFWLHDTPGAINDAQVHIKIYLTTLERLAH